MNPTIKLLIVDDEQIMREGLRLTVDWENYGFSVIGVASNGEKALRLCENDVPDMVITDIRMPIMDGLELTKELIHRYPKIKIIILSAYDDFKYAQKALSYGASEYLLKSELECEHLLTLAIKIAQDIVLEKNSQNEAQHLKTQFMEHLRDLQHNLCWNLLIAPQYPPEIRDEIRQLSMDLKEDDLVLIHIYIQPMTKPIPLSDACFSKSVIRSGFWLTSSNRHYIFVGNAASHAVPLFSVSQEMASLKNRLQQTYCKSCSIFYSPIFSGFENVYQYNQIIVDYSRPFLFYQHNGVYFCKELDYHMESLEITPILTKYIQLMECNQFAPAVAMTRQICASFANHFYSPDDIRNFITLICSILEEKAQKADSVTADSFQQLQQTFVQNGSTKQTFSQYEQLPALLSAFENYERSLLQFIEKNTYPYHSIVKKAIQYIHNHLSEEITLQLIANEIYCNPTYLSQLFKEEVHLNFSDFLIQARIKQATLLLTTTSLSIGEIAEQVGIPNQSYFSRTFTRFTGIQPSRYRQSVRADQTISYSLSPKQKNI